ncbi:hypothetical protein BACPU_26300 [Bacillus pumilus]|nr:hypothetical protein BACPU_26300 [Bacillus pumilus]
MGLWLTSAAVTAFFLVSHKENAVKKKVIEKDSLPETLNVNNKEVKQDEVFRAVNEQKKVDARKQQAKAKANQKRLRAAAIAREQKQKRLDAERKKRAKTSSHYSSKVAVTPTPKTQKATSQQRKISIEFTYYVALCDTGCSGVTATGHDVRKSIYYNGMRIVATDPNVIPTYSIIEFVLGGTKVKAIALDTGGAIKGNKIDMLVATQGEAMKMGRNTKNVTIIRSGK